MGRVASPDFPGRDGENAPVLDVFVPDQGDRSGMAAILVDSAEAHAMHQHVKADAARGGFWISNDLADVVYADDEAEPEPAPETPDEAPAKTGSTTKNKSQKGSTK